LQDYDTTADDPNQQWMASQGILLTNYWALGHPSEPNYASAAAGDQFGMDNDDWHQIPANISTVVDLLDTKGISWAEYQESLPYAGFQGYNYSNQETYANDYVRKHNPLILYDSVASNDTRNTLIKNFTGLYNDINADTLPQWAFITPNMTNDAHDTNVTFGSTFERAFIQNLTTYSDVWNDTLILLTWDESGNYTVHNRVYSILLGGAIPDDLVGTTDDTFYTHYSSLATVEANWGLPSLGRWDCGANIFQIVANKTGYTNYEVDTTNLWLNSTFYGPLSDDIYSNYTASWTVPATGNETCSAGYGILDSVKTTWGGLTPSYNYTSPFPFDTADNKDVGVAFSRNGTTWISGVNNTVSTTSTSNTTSTTTSSSSSSTASSGAASLASAPGAITLAVSALLAVVAAL
jgi:acid phosphatase